MEETHYSKNKVQRLFDGLRRKKLFDDDGVTDLGREHCEDDVGSSKC
jgi:hypothetical protein